MADVEIKGLSELLAAMKRLPKDIDEKCLKISVMSGAAVIRRAAAELVVRGKTGLLAKSIKIGFTKRESGPGKKVYHVFIGTKNKLPRKYKGQIKMWPAFYAGFVEFGTSKMAAKPYLRPAFDAMAGDAAEQIKTMLAKRIEIEAAKLGKS